ncbi:type II toxin-antitoxin system RelE/ParE family toxin [Burkholderia alba]|uniref:type II toxin-antitoxin system RelE/ParE family toxin n=1 Tax=Burkholderia alba TaxID=2683677 RepID=UPI002B055A9A|nr:type II toxin-antitoxin system RelE/ParE family toxin [Burkholderia alba]
MKVVWTPEALLDRDAIWEAIEVDNAVAAADMDERFSAAAAQLADFPLIGRLGQVSGTREFIPHPSYRLVYDVASDVVWILAVVHTARRWPPVHE